MPSDVSPDMDVGDIVVVPLLTSHTKIHTEWQPGKEIEYIGVAGVGYMIILPCRLDVL